MNDKKNEKEGQVHSTTFMDNPVGSRAFAWPWGHRGA
jgi:hypothetical protein